MNLLNHGIGSKMSEMEQAYSHQHMLHAHHTGLVIGTLVGSCAVTVFAALAIVAARPSQLLHPLSLSSQITVQQPNNTQAAKPGTAATQADAVLPGTHGSAGVAGRSFSQEFSHY